MEATQGNQARGSANGDSRMPPVQFSLQQIFLLILFAASLCAVAARFPRQATFAAGMSMLLLCPLLIAAIVCGLIRKTVALWLGDDATHDSFGSKTPIRHPAVRIPAALLRFLGLAQPSKLPSSFDCVSVAVSTSASVVLLWPLLREVGHNFALILGWPLDQVWVNVQGMLRASERTSYWQRLWHWEFWSIQRWWLLFGAIAVLWIAVAAAFSPAQRLKIASSTIKRLLLFAPWIAVLEVLFLAGVWLNDFQVVPEPSTGFVVGIFSWKLWHWDAWLDRGWLIRGAAPTFVVGIIFFRTVLRWRWPAVLVGAIALIPIALLLSIAWTVGYSHP